MSTVNNRAVKTSGTDVLSSWKTQKNLREGGGGGVVATSLVRPYVRGLLCKNLRQTASDKVQFLKQEPA